MKIQYNPTATSVLCEIGRKYGARHGDAYTRFYDSIFRDHKDRPLDLAEIGILDCGSLQMWQEYLPNTTISGFIYNSKEVLNNDHITLIETTKTQIQDAIRLSDKTYDIIIITEDSVQDQMNAIDDTYLKPGGILIIETSHNETDYPTLSHFQMRYFVELDLGKNLLVLIKAGAEPIFKNKNKLTIITPCYRLRNLEILKESINFDYVHEWIIVYDGSKIKDSPNLFANHDKIKEYVHSSPGVAGHPQRNYAMTKISCADTYIYHLDDDNTIYAPLYRLLDILDCDKIYTFNQKDRIRGNDIRVNHIDTAMFLIHHSLCIGLKWRNNEYNADGHYITACYNTHKSAHIYVDADLCTYNVIKNT